MTPTPAPPIQGLSLPAADASPLLASFTTFLTLSLHALLYHRALYPPATFLTARALNLLVRQSRHPGLCNWINDAVAAVAAQLESGAVRRIAVVMHAPETLKVLERWVFDVETFPVWGSVLPEEEDAFGDDHDVAVNEEDLEPEEHEDDDDEDVEMEPEDDDDDDNADLEDEGPINWTEVNEALRGALCRISHAAESKPALPKGSTFSLAVELRDDEPPPIGHPQPWIPSRPRRKRRSKSRRGQGASRSGGGIASTTAIRSVHAGPLFFECWMEQADEAS